jgi:hypothetical protein
MDSDSDGIPDSSDNCPDICNAQQLDSDEDGIGDVCDAEPGCGGCGQDTCEITSNINYCEEQYSVQENLCYTAYNDCDNNAWAYYERCEIYAIGPDCYIDYLYYDSLCSSDYESCILLADAEFELCIQGPLCN